jgi:GNAT superfamily N-acetyltransferase
MAIKIVPASQEHLPQMQALINAHLGAVVPGWGLPLGFIASRLRSNPDEFVVDPWVIERRTLCAVEQARVVAIAHLLRYGAGPEVSADFRGGGEIDWFLAWPEATEASATLLSAAREHFKAWDVARPYACSGWPGPLLGGVPDVWPHIAEALAAAGYRLAGDHREALYGGPLEPVVLSEPPVPGLKLQRQVGSLGVNHAVFLDDQKIGWCVCIPDLTNGGELPSFRGWAELGELWIDERWRNRGIGTWLVQHAVDWLRLGGCDRIILAVAESDEVLGAGRFYSRFGWQVLTRYQKGWRLM